MNDNINVDLLLIAGWMRILKSYQQEMITTRAKKHELRQGGCLTKDVSNKIHTLMTLILTVRDN